MAFLEKQVQRTSREIKSAAELREVKKGVYAVYLGGKNQKFLRYFAHAFRDPNFTIYHSFDRKVRREVARESGSESGMQQVILIRRSEKY